MNNRLRWFSGWLAALLLAACAGQPPRPSLEAPLSAVSARQGLGAALATAREAGPQGLPSPGLEERYQKAVMDVVQAWTTQAGGAQAASLRASHAGQSFLLNVRQPPGLKFDELIPASSIKPRELSHRMTREGVGVPYVAWWKSNAKRQTQEPFMSAAGYLTPVTVTLRFEPGSTMKATLTLHDPRVQSSVRMNEKQVPLAADFTSPGEFLLSRPEVRMSGVGALINSGKHLDKLGLISLEPPQKDRVPVILVHGLMSRPATWQNVVNELWSDPVLQRRCQFYFFRYPTGVPVIYSAAKLREKLTVLHQELSKAGATSSKNHMVLIGHSMGGLVSKSQVQSSGDRLWVNVFGTTPDKLKLSSAELQKLRSYLEYEPNPYISRVIFVATPHRGSQMAEGMLGAMGRSLVNLPGNILSDATQLMTGGLPEHGPLGELAKRGIPTSINNLSPKSKFVQTSINLPLRQGAACALDHRQQEAPPPGRPQVLRWRGALPQRAS